MKIQSSKRIWTGTICICAMAVLCFCLTVKAGDVESMENQSSELKNQLSDINEEIIDIGSEIADTEEKIEETQGEIEKTKEQLAIARHRENEQYEEMKVRIKYMYENDSASLLEVVCEAQNMSDFLNKLDFIQNISEYDREKLEELHKLQTTIADQEKHLTKEQKSQKDMKAKLSTRKKELQAKADQTGADIESLREQIKKIKDEEARKAGGLKIIGTERHEARRIDNQLRGRSGRQGDPGESRFYISLEDDLMRLFGSERLMGIFNTLGVPENEEIEHKMLTDAIEKAQMKIENNNFGIRKNLLEYDQVMNEQREVIYAERRRVLDGESMRDSIYKMLSDVVENTVDMFIGDDQDPEEWDLTGLNETLLPIIPLQTVTVERLSCKNKAEMKHALKQEATRLYEAKEAEFPNPELIRELERVFLLKTIDRKWMNHIDDMEQLRQGIGLQAYGQRDPLVEYKMSGYEMFEAMTGSIQEDTVRILMHIKVEEKAEREEVAKVTGTNKDDSLGKKPVQRAAQKVYPNDPCPCGSGKKYKQCCGRK